MPSFGVQQPAAGLLMDTVFRWWLWSETLKMHALADSHIEAALAKEMSNDNVPGFAAAAGALPCEEVAQTGGNLSSSTCWMLHLL